MNTGLESDGETIGTFSFLNVLLTWLIFCKDSQEMGTQLQQEGGHQVALVVVEQNLKLLNWRHLGSGLQWTVMERRVVVGWGSTETAATMMGAGEP
jgi:hypothetical protein